MAHDPLGDVALPPPPDQIASAGIADPGEAANQRREHRRIELTVAARRYVQADMLATSPYALAAMAPATLREHAAIAQVPNRGRIDDIDLRRILYYLDAQAAEQGRRPIAVPVVEMTAAPSERVPLKIPTVPRSPTNQWKVTKTAPHVAIPGGQFTIHAGTILDLESYAPETIASLVAQGVQLEAYPVAVTRHTCDVCETSWPADLAPAKACPACHLIAGERREATSTAALIGELRAQLDAAARAKVDVDERLEAMGMVLERRGDHHAALIRWAVAQGARPPDGDGTWQGEPHPPPLEVVTEEAGRVRAYQALIAGGMSDAEARGSIWPEPPAPAATSPAPSPAVVDELAAVAEREPAPAVAEASTSRRRPRGAG